MFNIQNMEFSHQTFERLMFAALRLKGIHTQAELARELNLPDQHITNWKARGVPKDWMIDLADEWGFRAKWIKDNDGNMVNDYIIPANSIEARVCQSLKQMDEPTKYQVVKICDSLAQSETKQNGT